MHRCIHVCVCTHMYTYTYMYVFVSSGRDNQHDREAWLTTVVNSLRDGIITQKQHTTTHIYIYIYIYMIIYIYTYNYIYNKDNIAFCWNNQTYVTECHSMCCRVLPRAIRSRARPPAPAWRSSARSTTCTWTSSTTPSAAASARSETINTTTRHTEGKHNTVILKFQSEDYCRQPRLVPGVPRMLALCICLNIYIYIYIYIYT